MVTPPNDMGVFTRRTGIAPGDLALLSEVPLFSGLPPDQLLLLLADASVRLFARGTILFLQDEPATRFYVIFDGWVKLFRQTSDGQESVIAVFTRGESFAEAAMFEKNVFPVSASVVEDARILVVPAERFIARIKERGELALNLLASMSRHLRRLVRQVENLTVNSSAERLAGFLYRLSPKRPGPIVVHLPFDKSLLAGRLGMQPETLSRALARLRMIGVKTEGLEVTISDVAKLGRFSEGAKH